MQQLTIPFPEFCEVANSENVAATEEQRTVAEQLQAAVASVKAWLGKESKLCRLITGEKVSHLTAIYGTTAVVSGFLFVSFAVIIGG